MQDPPIVEAQAVTRRYPTGEGWRRRRSAQSNGIIAVDGVSLRVERSRIVGLVGESGSGKSTLGRLLTAIESADEGEIAYDGTPIKQSAGTKAKRSLLPVQMIFQDPHSSLNPRMSVYNIIGEAPLAHGLVSRSDLADWVAGQLRRVGLDPSVARRFPHEFSGGQRQRIGIARALAVSPRVLVCDEAVSALDVSIQAQILNLFIELRSALSLTYVFISHDLGVVRHLSDEVAVMYLGRIVEMGSAEELFEEPAHPYTRGLVDEIRTVGGKGRVFKPMQGEIPSALSPPDGCHFHPRCPFASTRCRHERPTLRSIAPGRVVACHLHE